MSETTRTCAKCKQTFPLTSEFFPLKSADRFEWRCRECKKTYLKTYYAEHKQEASDAGKRRYAEHGETIRAQAKAYHKEQISASHKIYRDNHKDQISEKKKQYYEIHKDQDNARRRAYRLAHLEQEREHRKLYRETHKEILRERRKLYRMSHRDQVALRNRQWQQTQKAKEYKKRWHQENREEISRKHHEKYILYREQRLESQRLYARSERGRFVDRAHRHRRRALKKASCGSYTPQQLQDQLQRQKKRCYYCHLRVDQLQWHADHIVPISKGGSNTIDNIVIACPTCNMSKHARFLHEWPEGGRLL